ncbi:MAG TPA: hypothetical protein VL461_14785 [Dictyobacter sp.]|jgi:hypothetical protein|nr:hypothetical protein [Dictyobacter sp.]
MQKQQPASYDLLAVFPDENRADDAAAKLHKEGFADDEVYQLPANSVGNGQFREHGPNSARRDYFLQTQRTGPNPVMVIVLAIVFGVILGAITFGATFALPTLPEPITLIVGIAVGLVLGAIIGLLQRGRVRGSIGQNAPPSQTAPPTRTASGTLTIVALRFTDPDNISRKSRARAILLNNQGKIDRSVTRTE